MIGLCASLAACSEGVESAASFTFDAPDPSVGDAGTTASSTGDDPTAGSGGISDSATPTTGPNPTDPTDPTDPTLGSDDTAATSGTGSGGTACTPGTSQDCYTGPAGTQDVGPCAAGTQTCRDDGTWGSCEGEELPATEACDGEDNDCDGVTDNGNPGGGDACNTGLPGPCQPGTLVCEGGALACDGNLAPAASETCGNGIDDDCSGQVDDGCSCDPGNPGLDCAANESCFPSQVFGEDAVCDGPVGSGIQYSTCVGDSSCAPGHVCVEAGPSSIYCMQWCTSFLDCPLALDDCVFLEPAAYAGAQEWGVCYDGFP